MGPPREHGGMPSLEATGMSIWTSLQWGRRVNTAECLLGARVIVDQPARFNGAAA